MADRIGQRLGNYRLTRLLGKGGFAEVYLGEHLRLGTQAAVKVLHTRLASSDEVDKFQQEAHTIAHLKHPHIVRVLDFDVIDDTPFLVMDYAPNGTLRTLHPKGTILPLSTIVAYIKQLADALQHAHNQRLIHRDIKPGEHASGRAQQTATKRLWHRHSSAEFALPRNPGHGGNHRLHGPRADWGQAPPD